MKKIDILGYILMIFVVIIILKIYKDSDLFQLKCHTKSLNYELINFVSPLF